MLSYKSFSIRLNEGLLKTFEIEPTIKILDNNLINMGWYSIKRDKNCFSILFDDLKSIHGFDILFTTANTLGWFPSSYRLYKKNKTNTFSFIDINKFENDIINCDKINIYFESKFDIKIKKPNVCYHVFCDLNLNKIKKIGLVPKSLNKMSSHPERIYMTNNIIDSIDIGNKLKNVNLMNDKTGKYNNINYGIVEVDLSNIDVECYKDPKYDKGFYILSNITYDKLTFLDIII
ncbi:hypothetical protein M0Q50_07610 [bacterium]|jgi:hypothetical protein|nr:hypothetical protein [bacterium]